MWVTFSQHVSGCKSQLWGSLEKGSQTQHKRGRGPGEPSHAAFILKLKMDGELSGDKGEGTGRGEERGTVVGM